jgi:hypothetical protein
MYDNSFTVVQVAQIKRSSIPLVLLHDGGGTIFSYHALGPLNRDVYGISNPRFEDGKAWEGGIHEMAQAYAQMIKAKIPRGKILLGGTRLDYPDSGAPTILMRNRLVIWWIFGPRDILHPRARQ